MARFGELDTQYFDASGDPLSGGKIYFFESGTTTPKTTYADINNSIPNTHPVVLDAAGRQPNIFFDGVAKATLTDSADVTIVTRDPVGETATNFGDEWVSTRIYTANDVVIASDGQYYRSLQSANQNNNPTTTSGYWTLLYSVEWNSGITYGISATVTYDNIQYQSLQASNTNHQPDTSPLWWVPLNFSWSSTATYADDQNVVGSDGVLYTSQQASNLNNDPTDAANRPTWWVGTSADAAASAAAAATSEANAATSETNAATSETNAANSATASATSATNSATSATASATSATNAATSETNASNSATAAATSATNAATSETNAGNSATAAATSATNAATSETNASNSETAAATSATNAATSETNAGTSETNAANSATAASTSATNAATSETNASNSATAAATSATNSATSATASASSATSAASSATSAEAAWDQFDDTYLGQKASDPTTDNDGNPLATGALYFNTSGNILRVYNGTNWQDAGSAVNGTSNRYDYTATSGQTSFNATYDIGYVDVYMNGVKLDNSDFTANDGSTIVLGSGASAGDLINIIGYGTFTVANVLQSTNNLSDVQSASTSRTNLGLGTIATQDASAVTVTGTFTVNSTEAAVMPVGTTAQRPTAAQGMIRFNTTDSIFEGYDGTDWTGIGSGAEYAYTRSNFTATAAQTTFTVAYTVGYVDVYLNGVKLVIGTDVTATSGTDIVLASGAAAGDQVETIAYEVFSVANALTTSDLGVSVQAYDADTTKNDVANTFTADQTISGELTVDSYNESYNAVTSTSNATTIDCETGNVFSHTLTENTTFTFSNPPTTGTAYAFSLRIVQDASASGYTVTWPGSVDWASATAPTLTATASAVDWLVFSTVDGGTTWYGFVSGQALA